MTSQLKNLTAITVEFYNWLCKSQLTDVYRNKYLTPRYSRSVSENPIFFNLTQLNISLKRMSNYSKQERSLRFDGAGLSNQLWKFTAMGHKPKDVKEIMPQGGPTIHILKWIHEYKGESKIKLLYCRISTYNPPKNSKILQRAVNHFSALWRIKSILSTSNSSMKVIDHAYKCQVNCKTKTSRLFPFW